MYENGLLIPFDESQIVTINGNRYVVVEMANVREEFLRVGRKTSTILKNKEAAEIILKIINEQGPVSKREIQDQLRDKYGINITDPVCGHILSNLRRGRHIDTFGSKRMCKYIPINYSFG